MRKFLAGEKYNKLTVIEELAERNKFKQVMLKCLCECGNETITYKHKVVSGHTTSCGCVQDQNRKRRQTDIGDAAFNQYFRSYKRGARDRDLSFELTIEQFKELISKPCHYTGKPPRKFNPYLDKSGKVYTVKGKHYRSKESVDKAWIEVSGIDRIDNSIGYILENCVPCTPGINWAKRAMKYDDFIKMAYDIVAYQELKK